MSRTVEQSRAAYALEFINNLDSTVDREKLKTHIRKSPSLILQCGLGQAIAFLLADAEGKQKPSKIFYDALQDWLCGDTHKTKRPMRIYSQPPLMDALVNGSRSDYFRAQEEAIMLMDWLKKFADAKL